VTVLLARTGRHAVAVRALDFILPADPDTAWITLELVGEEMFLRALEAFRRSGRRELSFTDWTTVTVVRDARADAVVSFDEDFDGLVARVA
jgi:predicted nucleic acid-binding protein